MINLRVHDSLQHAQHVQQSSLSSSALLSSNTAALSALRKRTRWLSTASSDEENEKDDDQDIMSNNGLNSDDEGFSDNGWEPRKRINDLDVDPFKCKFDSNRSLVSYEGPQLPNILCDLKKRQIGSVDNLIDNVIRGSKSFRDFTNFNRSRLSEVYDIDDFIPANVGPSPLTDMQISRYWSLVVPLEHKNGDFLSSTQSGDMINVPTCNESLYDSNNNLEMNSNINCYTVMDKDRRCNDRGAAATKAMVKRSHFSGNNTHAECILDELDVVTHKAVGRHGAFRRENTPSNYSTADEVMIVDEDDDMDDDRVASNHGRTLASRFQSLQTERDNDRPQSLQTIPNNDSDDDNNFVDIIVPS